MGSHRAMAVAVLVMMALSVGAVFAQGEESTAPPVDSGAGAAPDPAAAPDGVGMAVPPSDAAEGEFEDGGFPTTTLVIIAVVVAVIALIAAVALKKKK